MHGYIVNLYKYAMVPYHSQKQYKDYYVKQHNDNEPRVANVLTFGDFDRIDIECQEKFERFRDLNQRSKKWLGSRQTILLYQLDGNKKDDILSYFGDVNKSILRDVNGQISQRFLIFTLCTIAPEIKQNTVSYGQFLKDCRQKIIALVKELQKQENFMSQDKYGIEFDIYGSFSSHELVIVWLSNQYSDIIRIVDQLRFLSTILTYTDESQQEEKRKTSVFLSLSSLISSLTRKSEENASDVEGVAVLQITYQSGEEGKAAFKEYFNDLGRKIKENFADGIIRTCDSVGEYDLIIEMPSKIFFPKEGADEAPKFFGHGGLLSLDDVPGKFGKFIVQTSIHFMFEAGDKDSTQLFGPELDIEQTFSITCQNNPSYARGIFNRIQCIEKIAKYFSGTKNEGLRNTIAKYFPQSAGMCDTMDLLFCDFASNESTLLSRSWAEDFYFQFASISQCINDIVKVKKPQSYLVDQMRQYIKCLINDFNQTIYHISASSRFSFEVPSCHIRYTGQYNMILRAYYGFVKELIGIIYSLKSTVKQPILVPLITVDAISNINSLAYSNNWNLSDLKEQDDETIIISLNLPLTSMVDFPRYWVLLIHEMFHYAVPYNRQMKNRFCGLMTATYFMANNFILRIEEIIGDNSTISKKEQNLIAQSFKENFFIWFLNLAEELEEFLLVHKRLSKIPRTNYIQEMVEMLADQKEKIYQDVQQEGLEIAFKNFLVKTNHEFETHLESWKNQTGTNIDLKNFIENIYGRTRRRLFDTSISKFKDIFPANNRKIDSSEFENSKEFLDDFAEAYVDISMIEVANLDIYEYLVIDILSKKELMLNINSKICYSVDRLGLIFDYYHSKIFRELPTNKKKCLDDFKKSCKDNFIGALVKIDSKISVKEAEDIFEKYHQSYNKFLVKWGPVREYLLTNLKMASFSDCSFNKQEGFSKYFHKWMDILRNADSKKSGVNSELFQLHVDMIQKYQSQESLVNLVEKNKGNNPIKSESLIHVPQFIKCTTKAASEPVDMWTFNVYSVTSLNAVLKKIYEIFLKQYGNDFPLKLWYRGQKSTKFKLLPSLIRKYVEKSEQQRNRYQSLAHYHRSLVEQFHFRSIGAPEILRDHVMSQIDYIVQMQHYSVPSNLMDWSEDAFAALYFTCEDAILHLEGKKEGSLFVFNPYLYNEARQRIVNSFAHESITTPIFQTIYNENKEIGTIGGNVLPNVAISSRKDLFEQFILGEKDNAFIDYKYDMIADQEWSDWKSSFLPLAILAPRNNIRIRHQSGMFLAYSLYSCPVGGKQGQVSFDYLELENIQRFYLKKFSQDASPFLYRINMPDDKTIKDISEWLRLTGMDTSKIYPDLVEIGRDTSKNSY